MKYDLMMTNKGSGVSKGSGTEKAGWIFVIKANTCCFQAAGICAICALDVGVQRSAPSWALTRSRKSSEMHQRLAMPTTV